MRYGFSTGDLPWRGLKAVARHFGIAGPGSRLHSRATRSTPSTGANPIARSPAMPPATSRRWRRWRGSSAARRLRWRGWRRGATSASRTPAPRPASSIRCSYAPISTPARRCPRTTPGGREPHTGAALHLFATGVAHRVVKADVASLYPSLMRSFRIGPSRDTLGAMLGLVDRLVERRLEAKALAKAAAAGLQRALHARGDVGRDEAGRELGVRLSRGRRRTDAVRGRPCRERSHAARPRCPRPDVPRAGASGG